MLFRSGARGAALDPKSALAHALYANALSANGRWEEARLEGERAITLNPNDYLANVNVAQTTFSRIGDHERSIALQERFLGDDPFVPPGELSSYGLQFYLLRRYESSATVQRRCIAVQPLNSSCHARLAMALAQLGRLDEARAATADAMRLLPTYRASDDLQAFRRRYRLAEDADLYAEGLRKAGFPE